MRVEPRDVAFIDREHVVRHDALRLFPAFGFHAAQSESGVMIHFPFQNIFLRVGWAANVRARSRRAFADDCEGGCPGLSCALSRMRASCSASGSIDQTSSAPPVRTRIVVETRRQP